MIVSTVYQQECEELSRKVAELTTENNALRTELDQLKKACEDMEAQNARLMVSTWHSAHTLPYIHMRNANFILGSTCPDGILTLNGEMIQSQEPAAVTTTLGMSIAAPKVQQHDDEGKLHKKANNNSNGKYVGGSRKLEANPR